MRQNHPIENIGSGPSFQYLLIIGFHPQILCDQSEKHVYKN
jgi:hypothetical protein